MGPICTKEKRLPELLFRLRGCLKHTCNMPETLSTLYSILSYITAVYNVSCITHVALPCAFFQVLHNSGVQDVVSYAGFCAIYSLFQPREFPMPPLASALSSTSSGGPQPPLTASTSVTASASASTSSTPKPFDAPKEVRWKWGMKSCYVNGDFIVYKLRIRFCQDKKPRHDIGRSIFKC